MITSGLCSQQSWMRPHVVSVMPPKPVCWIISRLSLSGGVLGTLLPLSGLDILLCAGSCCRLCEPNVTSHLLSARHIVTAHQPSAVIPKKNGSGSSEWGREKLTHAHRHCGKFASYYYGLVPMLSGDGESARVGGLSLHSSECKMLSSEANSELMESKGWGDRLRGPKFPKLLMNQEKR